MDYYLLPKLFDLKFFWTKTFFRDKRPCADDAGAPLSHNQFMMVERSCQMRRMPAKFRLRVWLKTFRVDEREQTLRDNATYICFNWKNRKTAISCAPITRTEGLHHCVKVGGHCRPHLHKLQSTVSASK